MCRLDERIFTVQDLTLRTFEEVKILLRDCKHAVPQDNQSGFLDLPLAEWDRQPDSRAEEYYYHVMRGVLLRLIASLVLDDAADMTAARVRRLRGDLARQAYNAERSRLWKLRYDLDVSLQGGMSESAALQSYQQHFPSVKWSPASIASLRESLPFERYVVAKCFPAHLDGKVAPWMDHDFDRCVLALLRDRYVRDHREKLWALTNLANADRTVLLFYDTRLGDSQLIAELCSMLVTEDGEVAVAGLREAHQTLTLLGSPTRLSVDKLSVHLLARQLSQPSEDIPVQEVLTLSEDNGRFDRAWTTVARVSPPDDIPIGPGSRVQVLGTRLFLQRPLDRVLKRIVAEPPFSLPDRNFLLQKMAADRLERTFMKTELPMAFDVVEKVLGEE